MTVLTPRIDAIEAGTSIAAASATVQGVVTTGSQVFAGTKTFNNIVTFGASIAVKGLYAGQASAGIMDFVVGTGATRLLSYGANDSTPGIFSFVQRSSAGTVDITSASTTTTGAWTLGPASFGGEHVVNGDLRINPAGREDATYQAFYFSDGANAGDVRLALQSQMSAGDSYLTLEATGNQTWTIQSSRADNALAVKNGTTTGALMSSTGSWTFGPASFTGSQNFRGSISGVQQTASMTDGNSLALQSESVLYLYNGALTGGITLGSSGTAVCIRVSKSTATNRSINAAGTINASGADYAEYMTKAVATDTIAPGEICGVDTNGLLTKSFSAAKSFVLKSTNPSYVGGDTWCPLEIEGESREDFEARIEVARQAVDRIAFCGQVPCLVTGSFNVGDWIIPQASEDVIQATAVSNSTITFEQFKSALGKVWKDLGNGTALVAVGIK